MSVMSKKAKAIFEKYGIKTVDIPAEKNLSTWLVMPDGMLIKPLLKQGNTKTGRKVYTFSSLATDQMYLIDIDGVMYELIGTCNCTCKDEDGNITCYGCSGHYQRESVKKSLAKNTIALYSFPDWADKAIRAQIEIIGKNKDIRINATGDIPNEKIAAMWHGIARDFNDDRFWSYTKRQEFETLFDNLPNANIVKSNIDGIGYNYGHIDYVLGLYSYLVAIGEHPYICPCGIEKNTVQHCYGCTSCVDNKYVLFVEHSTDYIAKNDPLYDFISDIAAMQNGKNHAELASLIDCTLASVAA